MKRCCGVEDARGKSGDMTGLCNMGRHGESVIAGPHRACMIELDWGKWNVGLHYRRLDAAFSHRMDIRETHAPGRGT